MMELVKVFAHWWPCACLKSVSGPRRPEKKFEFSEINICLWHGAQKLLRHKLLKLDAACLSLHCIGRDSWMRCWNVFFLTVFHVLDWSFFLMLFEETFAVGFQNWFDYKWIEFGGFFKVRALLVEFVSEWTKYFQKCWNLCLIWQHQGFSITSLRVNPVCCSNVLVLFSHTFL